MRDITDDEASYQARMKPRAYDLTNPDELARLLRETEGYAFVSLRDGTDSTGRRFAWEALRDVLQAGFRLVPPHEANVTQAVMEPAHG